MTQTSIPTTLPDFINNLQSDPLTAVVNFYAARLPLNAKAVAFIADELKLTCEEAAKHSVGFSDRRLGKTLPSQESQQGRDLREQLKAVGLIKSTGHETLRGCITIPLFDDADNITGILGKRIDRKVKVDDITIGKGTAKTVGVFSELASATTNPPSAESNNPAGDLGEDADDLGDDLLIEDNQVTLIRDDRRYRVRGLDRNTNNCTLKVNILATRDDLVHLDTLDLVKARSRASFIKATAAELFTDVDLIKRDIGQLLLKLESLREQQINDATKPKIKTVELTASEQDEAMQLLRDPNLLDRIVADMDACGMVGEANNKLAGYLAATSRKLPEPLAIMIQSSSSAGKTSLMDAILAMMPDEDVNRFSGMTGQSLFYLDSDSIRHKILAISEDEGVRQATYALKLLQSEGELRHATTGRDSTGRMAAQQHVVQGPVQIMLTTTAMEIDEELINRCLVLTVDESRDQTDAIQAKQRESLLFDIEQQVQSSTKLRTLHQNAQRLILSLRVFNPYAPQLTFPNTKTRTRRDQKKYLTLINTIALLHQHQRQIHRGTLGGENIEYINVEPSDIETANRISGEILGRSLDELSPQTRNCLNLTMRFAHEAAKANGVSRHAFRFTRRDLREATGWSDFQLRMHLTKLDAMEYIVVHRGKQGRRFVYELLYNGEATNGKPFLVGLTDPKTLKAPATTPSSSITQ